MKTQIELAREGVLTEQMQTVADDEKMDAVRRAVLAATTRPVGNVPLYQAFKETTRKTRNPANLDPE